MIVETKQDIVDVLQMPYDRYLDIVAPYAKRIHEENNQNALTATAMLGYDNICKNRCLYCGMRAGSTNIKRYQESISGFGGLQHCLLPAPKMVIIGEEDGAYYTKLFSKEQTYKSMLKILGY